MDPAVASVLGILISSVIGPVLILLVQRRQGRVLAATHEQVANTHDTNLRDDLDKLQAQVVAMRGDVTVIRAQVTTARADLADVKASSAHTDEKVSRIGGQLDAHLTSAAATDAGVHARLAALENRQEKP
ncbi:DUF2746 domain-containing protein [Nocardioides sp. L-11A]|uniref:DUF2746 domain-containing protein n=1 Tax=Nocardioides sp. L-11A TaxID=3043848 RepID=UPI00249C216C|nr:DUF2746 domain-containing protein [Nocardioides sp. L-11A]